MNFSVLIVNFASIRRNTVMATMIVKIFPMNKIALVNMEFSFIIFLFFKVKENKFNFNYFLSLSRKLLILSLFFRNFKYFFYLFKAC